MINRIIDFSVEHRGFILLLLAAACVAGCWALASVPLDAIPELGDTQVIIYSRWDRSPDIIEDQVTYPLVTAMLGAPKVKTVRGISDFGYSYVYVIFEDGTDLYWARSRTLEYLSGALSRLPQGVKTELGPDATALGWVFQYALVDSSGKHTLADLRSYEDWYLRYYLKSVPGVAEVATVGGFTRQFQVNVDPNRLQAYGISINRVVEAVRNGNNEVGGRLLEFGGTEYMVRGRGYARSLDDFGNIVLAASDTGSPIRIKDVGEVEMGPDLRRGVADLDGAGEVVSGIVVMRSGENALDVVNRVKAKVHEIEAGFPEGVKLVPVYDRSELIHRAISSVRQTIIEIVITVVLIILVFLWHFPSAAIPIATMPIAVLLSFIPFKLMGITANIMSLAGVAIAFGELVDASIIVAEQTHKKLEIWERGGRVRDVKDVVIGAIKDVAPTSFFALLVIAISFLPVLTLQAQEGRMFRPLAYTKTLAMLVAAALAITVDPALRTLMTRLKKFSFQPSWLCRLANALMVGRVASEETHPISAALMRVYEPALRWTLRWKWVVLGAAAVLVAITVPVFFGLGSEFMPPLDEGTILYMPTTLPGISLAQAQRVLGATDGIIRQFPEVDRVLGKAGRADTSTDPAPLSMLETIIILKPRSQWRHVHTWYSSWAPEAVASVLRHITPDTISPEQLTNEMNSSLNVPGLANAWTMPIRGRIEMLTTGIRTSVGLKISGPEVTEIQALGTQAEFILHGINGTRGVFSERPADGYFVDIQWNREELARYGISLEEAQETVQNAIGGENVTTAVIGRERYPVNVRYMRGFRNDMTALGRVLLSAGGQRQVPLSKLARIKWDNGPAMIRDENGLLTGYVYVDLAGRDAQSYIDDANRLLRAKMKLPIGYTVTWSGQYEAMQRAKQRLKIVVPITLFLVILLLYANTGSLPKTLIVLLAVPFSAVGAVWFLYVAGYNMSVGVWVGLIALLGVDAETGVFMLLYLDLAYEEARDRGRLNTLADLREVVVKGAAKRLRPKFMTFATTCIGLFPVMWSVGTGSDVMKRIAAPMVGGIFTSFVLELLVYPAVYELWKKSAVSPEIEASALMQNDDAELHAALLAHR
ncbi:MAG: efflux RND transporter permease subunit [Acidobacteria bacterium]|nr:efflux RND transporter permease subunit [Acidobacteriota bacterium]MBV9145039.1 efflux RND transporter permease subunit [Acidobacteriota bacterium]MBV9435268.1 efflux RND transporter permease subunit [Acidobacteriota bacterium]